LSAFTTGLINAIHALEGRRVSQEELANEALHVEQDVINEPVGSQDQLSAAFGGFNHITFRQDGSYQVNPLIVPRTRLELLQDHLMLLFTGISRLSTEVAAVTIANLPQRETALQQMQQMVDQGIAILASPAVEITDFGRLLHESWLLKRSLADRVSSASIDDMYSAARAEGAIGGKILGAGGGGFLLLFVKPEDRARVRERLKTFIDVPFRFENSGSRIVLYQPDGW